jgi:flagellar biosynthesis chaperone FliJ
MQNQMLLNFKKNLKESLDVLSFNVNKEPYLIPLLVKATPVVEAALKRLGNQRFHLEGVYVNSILKTSITQLNEITSALKRKEITRKDVKPKLQTIVAKLDTIYSNLDAKTQKFDDFVESFLREKSLQREEDAAEMLDNSASFNGIELTQVFNDTVRREREKSDIAEAIAAFQTLDEQEDYYRRMGSLVDSNEKYRAKVPKKLREGEEYTIFRCPVYAIFYPFLGKEDFEKAHVKGEPLFPGYLLQDQILVGISAEAEEPDQLLVQIAKSLKSRTNITYVNMSYTKGSFTMPGSSLNYYWFLDLPTYTKFKEPKVSYVGFPFIKPPKQVSDSYLKKAEDTIKSEQVTRDPAIRERDRQAGILGYETQDGLSNRSRALREAQQVAINRNRQEEELKTRLPRDANRLADQEKMARLRALREKLESESQKQTGELQEQYDKLKEKYDELSKERLALRKTMKKSSGTNVLIYPDKKTETRVEKLTSQIDALRKSMDLISSKIEGLNKKIIQGIKKGKI